MASESKLHRDRIKSSNIKAKRKPPGSDFILPKNKTASQKPTVFL
jgi:hypothetical protein